MHKWIIHWWPLKRHLKYKQHKNPVPAKSVENVAAAELAFKYKLLLKEAGVQLRPICQRFQRGTN